MTGNCLNFDGNLKYARIEEEIIEIIDDRDEVERRRGLRHD